MWRKGTLGTAATTLAQLRWQDAGRGQVAAIPVRDHSKGPLLGLRPEPAPWADATCGMYGDMTFGDQCKLAQLQRDWAREYNGTVVLPDPYDPTNPINGKE